jgi:hypothetical protein
MSVINQHMAWSHSKNHLPSKNRRQIETLQTNSSACPSLGVKVSSSKYQVKIRTKSPLVMGYVVGACMSNHRVIVSCSNCLIIPPIYFPPPSTDICYIDCPFLLSFHSHTVDTSPFFIQANTNILKP